MKNPKTRRQLYIAADSVCAVAFFYMLIMGTVTFVRSYMYGHSVTLSAIYVIAALLALYWTAKNLKRDFKMNHH
ncbi:MAG: hypothetical protein ABF899_02150 [Oenococcus sp.]|uniref:hypothetical protein n=1 Tax=Oenococcus sp. TaxID=1979414 RepID=UPI0039E7F756